MIELFVPADAIIDTSIIRTTWLWCQERGIRPPVVTEAETLVDENFRRSYVWACAIDPFAPWMEGHPNWDSKRTKYRPNVRGRESAGLMPGPIARISRND